MVLREVLICSSVITALHKSRQKMKVELNEKIKPARTTASRQSRLILASFYKLILWIVYHLKAPAENEDEVPF